MAVVPEGSGEALFEEALSWLRARYGTYLFFTERDLVWTVQLQLLELVEERSIDLRVFNDYPMLPGTRADVALVSPSGAVEVAAEFKYEPSHQRADIPKTKFPVVFWDSEGVGKDVQRARDFVAAEKAGTAYAVFIDEGGAFRHRDPHSGSTWIDWETDGPEWLKTSILWTRIASADRDNRTRGLGR
jgi:hypothetical protein